MQRLTFLESHKRDLIPYCHNFVLLKDFPEHCCLVHLLKLMLPHL